jgi:HPt (histidine-containing phosphotransfer) domain-containing protein
MTQSNGHDLPLLDPSVLERLRADLDDDDNIWRLFVHDFIAQLPARLQRLRQTLTTGDSSGAMDAVLSLRTSSQMVGAERLAGLALQLERSMRDEARDANPATALPLLAADHLRQLQRCAQQTTNILEAHTKRKK